MTTSWPSACAARTRHAQTSSPSRSTEHEPHSPCSHAFFDPGRPSRSRSANSRLSPAQTSASRASPLTRQRDPHAASVLSSARRVSTRSAWRRYAAVPRTSSIGDAASATRSGNESASSSGARTRPTTGPAEPYAARSSPFGPQRERADGDHHRVPRADLHERLGAAGARRARRRSARRARARSASGRRRTPRAAAAARRGRSRPRPRRRRRAAAGSRRPPGEAVPRLPPIVARLRICGEPTVRAASASAGSASRERPVLDLGVGEPGAEAQAAVVLAPPAAQLGDLGQVQDRSRAGVVEVERDHHVRPALDRQRLGVLRLEARAPRRACAG